MMTYTYKYYKKIFSFYALFFILHLSFFISLSSCGGGSDEDNSCILDRLTDEELDKFNPNNHLTEGSGQSEAFKIHPLNELRISAPAGAFDVNPNIQVSVATDEQLEQFDAMVSSELQGEHLLWAYDIDAGLPSDSVLPGKYKVEINLKKLGIPKELYPAINLWRVDGDGKFQPLNTQLRNDVIHYDACQNSAVVTTIGVAILAYVAYKGIQSGAIGIPLKTRLDFEGWKNAGYPLCFWKKSDLIQVPVEDKFGNFKVLFLHSKTEDCDHSKEYIEKTTQLSDRLEALEKQAEKKYNKENSSLKHAWLGRAEAEKMRRIEITENYMNLLKADTLTRNLIKDPAIRLPQSVQDVITGTKLANRFSQDKDGLGLKPLSYDYWVYIVPSSEFGSSATKALFQPYPIVGGTIYVNYDGYLKNEGGKITYDRKKTDPTCVNMAHEIGHAYEHEYVTSIFLTDKLFLEAIGSVTEHWFAAWMKRHGYINDADTESKATAERLEYAERDCKQLLAWPLGLKYPDGLLGVSDQNTHGGYMLADLIQFLCENKKKVNFDQIMKGYAYNKSFVEDMKDIFGFTSDREFYNMYEKFCWKFMPEIVKCQRQYMTKAFTGITFFPIVHTPEAPVHRLAHLGHKGSSRAYPFAVKNVQIKAKNGVKLPYTLFAAKSGKTNDINLKFTFLEGDSMQQAKNRYYIKPCDKEFVSDAYAALFYRPGIEKADVGPDYYFDIIALYQPKTLPKVLGESKDGGGLNINTGEAPNEKLVKFKYITGMQLAVINNATKTNKTFFVPLEKCGKTFKIPYNSIQVKDPEAIDIAVRSRWYYEDEEGHRYFSPATERISYKREKTKPADEIENKDIAESSDNSDFKTNMETVSDDKGPILITRKFKIDLIQSHHRKNYSLYDEAYQVYATLEIKKDYFTLKVPAHTTKLKGEYALLTTSIPSFTISGKCKVDIELNQIQYDYSDLRITPSSFTIQDYETESSTNSTGTEVLSYKESVKGKEYAPLSNGLMTLELIMFSEYTNNPYYGYNKSEDVDFIVRGHITE